MTEHPTTDELREDVERTRERLADTVDELSAKFDVKSRLHESANEAKESARESVMGPDGRPRPEVLSLAGGIAAWVVAFLLLRSLRRSR